MDAIFGQNMGYSDKQADYRCLMLFHLMSESTFMDGTNTWYVYIVKCSDNSLYTGITMDIERRVQEHNSDNLHGAKYTRARRPVFLVYKELFSSRSKATKREREIKHLNRIEKEALIRQHQS